MNKLIVVTGGTKGIGKAILSKFLANGFDGVTCSRHEQDLEDLKDELGSKHPCDLLTFRADLSDAEQMKQFVQYVVALNRPIDVLVNNAGLFRPGMVHREDEGLLELLLHVNLLSAYHTTRGLIGPMMERKRGHIFNMCSTASIIPYVNGGSYCISKFALLGFSKVLREEMKVHNIRVTAVMPGATFTASWEGVDVPEERFMPATDVAEAVYGAYSLSDRSVIEELLIRPQLGDL